MNISINNSVNYIATQREAQKLAELQSSKTTSATSKSSRNFDGITIQSSEAYSPEKTFQSNLARKLSLEVRQPVSPQKIEEIQTQVQNGAYTINPNAIAERIMLG